ncbi:MAG: Dabb family protein [Coriobacteriia bacterium]|nr:Dabb family protein [Coriobacteriia bacterium]
MIKHIVAWRFKDEALGATRAENLTRARMALEALRESVPSVKHLEVGLDAGVDHDSWDIVLYSEFDDLEGLHAYQVHPEHVKVAQVIGEMRESRAAVDYEV